jgi:hypothetical protein
MAIVDVNTKPLQTKHWLALLAALFVIVLIAHLAIIISARGQFGTQKSAEISTFTTRMIELPQPTPVVEKAPEAVMPPKPVKPKAKLAAAPKEVSKSASPLTSLLTPQPTTQAAQALLTPPEESLAAAPMPAPVQSPHVVEIVPPTVEPAQTTTSAASGESGPPPKFISPVSATHVYKVIVAQKGSNYSGKAVALFQNDGERYDLSLSASQLLYSITWKSTGLVSPEGLLPERFSDKRTLKSEVAAHFDRNTKKIVFSANSPQAELEPGAQDRVSIIWQLAGLLAADPARYAPGTTLSIQTADDREAQTWIFTVNEPETINLENGSQVVWRLTRNPRREFDRKIELWFAPSMGYLPVRFRQTQVNGDFDDMIWQSTQVLQQIKNNIKF